MISPSPKVFHSVHDDRDGENLSALSPAKAAVSITVAEMKSVLQEADCFYDNAEIWKQLGAKNVPEIPDSVIQEAYEKGGRIILRCSSISEKTDSLRAVGCVVNFWEDAQQSDYTAVVSDLKWIIVPSYVDHRPIVGSLESAAPTEDSFAVRAYAFLDGGRQPKGCEDCAEYTSESGTAVGSFHGGMGIDRLDDPDPAGTPLFGTPCFGPARNCRLDIEKVGELKDSIVSTTQRGSLGMALLGPGIKIKDISPRAWDDFSL